MAIGLKKEAVIYSQLKNNWQNSYYFSTGIYGLKSDFKLDYVLRTNTPCGPVHLQRNVSWLLTLISLEKDSIRI
jgi:hypothetical protein